MRIVPRELLGGGIDSSTNAALFSEDASGPVKTFTIGYAGSYETYQNETAYAERMARDVLSNPVYNYSWPLFPYIWNEVKFQVAYDSDFEFIARTMQEVTEAELGESMMENVKVFRELLAQTPVDRLEVRERPAVFFRVGDNTWIEAIVRYVVPPREAGRIKTNLIKKLLERLNAEPERVKFPKSNMR